MNVQLTKHKIRSVPYATCDDCPWVVDADDRMTEGEFRNECVLHAARTGHCTKMVILIDIEEVIS